MKRMRIMFIDAHCDTASAMLDSKKVLKKNDLHFDLTRAPKDHTQVFAIYTAPEYYDDPASRVDAILNRITKEFDKKQTKPCFAQIQQSVPLHLKTVKLPHF